MNLRCGFRRMIFALAIISSIFATVGGIATVLTERNRVRIYLRRGQETLRFERETLANLQADPVSSWWISREAQADRIAKQSAEIEELKRSFWINLSKEELVGLCIMVGLGGAVVGYVGTWLALWFGGLAIYKLIKWLILGFRDNTGGKNGAQGKLFQPY